MTAEGNQFVSGSIHSTSMTAVLVNTESANPIARPPPSAACGRWIVDAAADEDTCAASRRPWQQLGQANQIESRAGEYKQPIDLRQPRSFTLRIHAMVFNHPNAGSIHGRAR